MKFRASHIVCVVVAAVWVLEPVNGLFPNTLNGFITDIQQNPTSLLALLVLKYWLLLSTGAISVAGPAAAAIGKRDVSGIPVNTDEFYAELLSKVDGDQCIPRLICGTLAQDGKTKGGVFKESITQSFGEKPIPESLSNPKSPMFMYKYAAYIGKYAPTPDACKHLFPKCKQSVSEMQKLATVVFESNV